MGPIKVFGTENQKSNILPLYVTGDKVGCFMLSEPGNGSDAGAASTRATQLEGGGWSLTGSKAWITNSYEASAGTIFATTDRSKRHKGISCFFLPVPSPGLTLGTKESKLGIRCTSTATVFLEDVSIPPENLLGRLGEGFKIAMEILDAGRIPIAAQAVGIAADALQRAEEHILRKDVVSQVEQELLAQMEVQVEAARLLTWKAASLKDQGLPIGKAAAMAKLFASEVATNVSHSAMQLMGEEGLVRGSGVERNYRDARITEIYEGTSEIQKVVIAAHSHKEFRAKSAQTGV